jgi:6-pyruvoyltetrahydropterin/6-carboxytetrahydropterin synthase
MPETMMSMSRWTVFQSSHHLPKMPAGHKCRRRHGHTYRLTITCSGPVGDDGLIFDNALIDEVLMVVRDGLDHHDLNDLGFPFSDNPTAERILQWVWDLALHVPKVGEALHRIELVEGDRSTFSIERGQETDEA